MPVKDLLTFAKSLDRAYFIEGRYKRFADLDSALPIGRGQTISQPSLVLAMTELLDLEKDHKVLEIGTGSGYQTVILAEFSKLVYTVERIGEFSLRAEERLKNLGYSNVAYKIGDGSQGWVENAPYDRIMVTAAAREIPLELVDQLKIAGKMVIPVGTKKGQELKLLVKEAEDRIASETKELVRFVELKGKYGW